MLDKFYDFLYIILYIWQDPNVPTPELHDAFVGTCVMIVIFLTPSIIVRKIHPKNQIYYFITNVIAGAGLVLILLIILPYAAVQF